MRIKLPEDRLTEKDITLAIDGLPFLRLEGDAIERYLDHADGIELGKLPVRDRLLTALRILKRKHGSSFEGRRVEMTVEFTSRSPDATAFRIDERQRIATFAVNELLEACDVVLSGDKLVSGDMTPPKRRSDETTVVAFYLPQFYPFAENDKWWGDGFTEWTNVVEAQPNLPGHNMPLLPADLGFYDLRISDTRRRQGRMASEYGVDAFCYYFYWFDGRRIMDEVLEDILRSGVPDKDFCLCWANESWSRRWDGSEGTVDLLIKQTHDPLKDITIIDDLLIYFNDERYIKIDGSPVFLVYRLDIMNDKERVVAGWRAAAVKAGFPGLFVVAVRSFGLKDANATCVDAIVDFPPHTAVSSEIHQKLPMNAGFGGKVFDYQQVVINAAEKPPGTMMTFPGVMPRWDNTPRKSDRSHFFWNSSPGMFKIWMALALEQSQQLPLGRRFLFINSWNEWGEGAMLEPDRVYGRAYLEALRSVRGGYTVGPADGAAFSLVSALPPDGADKLLAGFAAEVHLVAQILGWQQLKSRDAFRVGAPPIVMLSEFRARSHDGLMIIDHSSSKLVDNIIPLRFGQPLTLIGWACVKTGLPERYDRVAYLFLQRAGTDDISFYTPLTRWARRPDVAEHHKVSLSGDEVYFGFEVTIGTDNVDEGTYRCGLLQAVDGELFRVDCNTTIQRTPL